jgi:hypothetical protein
MSIKWDKSLSLDQMTDQVELKEGMSLVDVKAKIASLPDIVPANMEGHIDLNIERRVET